jgi:hypothetical protein
MGGFLEAAISFPTVVFTPLLVVVIGYWVVVIVGGADPDTDTGSGEAGDGPLAVVGLSGVPLSVVFSLLVLFAWFGSLAGAELLHTTFPLWVVLIAAVVAAFILTRILVAVLVRVWPQGPAASRADFIGLTCVIRTGTVTRTFGQAEVHAPDGSSAIIQVRQTGSDKLTAGSRALLYDVDADGEFFWVVPADIALPE